VSGEGQKGKDRTSFLKKRSKKLLSIADGAEFRPASSMLSETDESFFGSFLQKRTPCFSFFAMACAI
jgi:hypothetical protein